MAIEQQLRVPGPTPIPQRVVRAASRPMIDHRGPEFAEMITEITAGLRSVLRTENDILLYPSSGTGGLEATVVNLLSPGEKVLVCTVGSFGDRWADIAQAYGADVHRLAVEWGDAIDADDVDEILKAHSGISTVFVTHNETSTGVVNDIPAIARVVKQHGKLLAVDSVSGAGCMPMETDAIGVDVLVTGSQKGWMSPPGLAMIAVSKAAFAKSENATLPRWYFDFAREKKFQDKKQTYTTPPLQVMYSLQEGLRIIAEEGVENVWARHRRIADMVRAGVSAIGLRFLAAESCRSDTVTAVRNPTDSPEQLRKLVTTLREQYGLVVAGGQDKLAGEIFRIGHLGDIHETDVYAILGTLEIGMVELGMLSRVGQCVAAAQQVARPATAAAAAG